MSKYHLLLSISAKVIQILLEAPQVIRVEQSDFPLAYQQEYELPRTGHPFCQPVRACTHIYTAFIGLTLTSL